MAPRPSWKGYLKLSLVSCPVALFPSSSSSEKLSLHMLNGETGHRLNQQYVDSETGELVERDARVKGYEVSRGEYVVVSDEELADVRIESNHTIDIERFVPKSEIDRLYFDNNYYLTPDDKVGEEAFAVIRDAMRQRDMVGIARVVLFGKQRMIMLEPRSNGLVGTTLRYGTEVRAEGAYFDDVPKVAVTKELLDLASHIIDTKAGTFQPEEFKDRYGDAVAALIRAKQEGSPAPAGHSAEAPSNVVNLMDALRRSLGQSGDGLTSDHADTGKGGKKASTKSRQASTKASTPALAKAAPPKSAPAKSAPAKSGSAKSGLTKTVASKAGRSSPKRAATRKAS